MPLIWQWNARDLICAANVLHQRYELEAAHKTPPPAGFHRSINPILLLYGLALENLLKGLLVARGVDATSTGELNNKLKTHNPVHLWQQAGLALDDKRSALLRNLHWSVESGKYPVGTKPDPEAPAPVWLALTNIEAIGQLLETAEDALRIVQGNNAFEKTELLKLCR